MNLTLLTTIIGVICCLGCYTWTRTMYTPCFWYWFAWALGLVCLDIEIARGVFEPLDWFAKNLILQLHSGAFFGFLGSSLLFRGRGWQPWSYASFAREASQPIAMWLWAIAAVSFVAGAVGLVEQVQTRGASSLAQFYAETREDWIAKNYRTEITPYRRVMAMLGSVGSILPIVLAARDVAVGAINRKQLGFAFLAVVPAGISTGGRGWLLYGVLPYCITAFFLCKVYKREVFARRIVKLGLHFAVAFVILVSMIGFFRAGFSVSEIVRTKESLANRVAPFVNYGAVPIAAISAYAEYAETDARAFGLASFDFIGRNMERFGIQRGVGAFYGGSRDYVYDAGYKKISTTHATIIPHLVKDVGANWVWLEALLLFGLFQGACLYGIGKGGFYGVFLFAWGGIYGAMSSGQTNSFGNTAYMFVLIAGLCYARVARRKVCESVVEGVRKTHKSAPPSRFTMRRGATAKGQGRSSAET